MLVPISDPWDNTGKKTQTLLSLNSTETAEEQTRNKELLEKEVLRTDKMLQAQRVDGTVGCFTVLGQKRPARSFTSEGSWAFV